MNMKTVVAATAICASALLGSYAPAARAGDVSNASLGCYVDTTAFDQLTSDYCFGGWHPGQPNPTTAYFQVVGLDPGDYTYSWSHAQCSPLSAWCNRPIRRDTSGGQPVTLSVTVYDNSTGLSKTVSATAEYVDVWN